MSAAIRRAIEKIRKRHPTLAKHLEDSIEFGSTVLYKGDPNARWETEGSIT